MGVVLCLKYRYNKINKEKTIDKVKQVWALAQANPKAAISLAIVVVAIYFLVT